MNDDPLINPLLNETPTLPKFDKTPAWKKLRPGQKWLVLNHKYNRNIEPGQVLIHSFPQGRKARMKLIESDYDNNHIFEFLEWV